MDSDYPFGIFKHYLWRKYEYLVNLFHFKCKTNTPHTGLNASYCIISKIKVVVLHDLITLELSTTLINDKRVHEARTYIYNDVGVIPLRLH